MIVFGFDPGSIRFGVGVVEKNGSSVRFLHSEVITLKEADFYLKMRKLWLRLEELYRHFPPGSAGMEEGFLGKNVKSMDVLARVRGLVLGSLVARDIPMISYSPRQVKMALTGSGAASKQQVERMVRVLLNLPDDKKKISNDESDALAVAYCHALCTRS